MLKLFRDRQGKDVCGRIQKGILHLIIKRTLFKMAFKLILPERPKERAEVKLLLDGFGGSWMIGLDNANFL